MKELEKLRKEIDDIDEKLVELFERRMRVVSEIAEYKRINNKEVRDEGREEEIIKRYSNRGEFEEEIIKFLKSMMKISREMQMKKNRKRL